MKEKSLENQLENFKSVNSRLLVYVLVLCLSYGLVGFVYGKEMINRGNKDNK